MRPPLPLFWSELSTPVGPLLLVGSTTALMHVYFQSGPHPCQPLAVWRHDGAPLERAATQLREYFAGTRCTFELPLAPAGTAFQLAVWQALRAIPYGQTRTYSQLARELGRGSARAVGLANGANPLPIIVPCHRVIGADGSLTGFGGGLAIKHALLSLEGAECVTDLFSGAAAPPAARVQPDRAAPRAAPARQGVPRRS